MWQRAVDIYRTVRVSRVWCVVCVVCVCDDIVYGAGCRRWSCPSCTRHAADDELMKGGQGAVGSGWDNEIVLARSPRPVDAVMLVHDGLARATAREDVARRAQRRCIYIEPSADRDCADSRAVSGIVSGVRRYGCDIGFYF